jgi:hypothetical protein
MRICAINTKKYVLKDLYQTPGRSTGVLRASFITQNPCGPRSTYSKDNPSLTDPALDFTQVPSGKNRLEWESNPQSPG